MPLNHLPQADPLVADALRQELARERDRIELIASENFTSPAVMEAVGSVLTNKYAEGYPRKRYYGGCEKVDLVEDLARERACQLVGAGFANVQPHCCANANFGAYTALLDVYKRQVMHRRVAEVAHFFGIEPWMRRATADLSGGQKQMEMCIRDRARIVPAWGNAGANPALCQ